MYLFTMVASINTALYNYLQTGTVVSIRPAENNPDPYAVEVVMDDTVIGFVANSSETVIPKTMSAVRMRQMITNKKVGETRAVLRKQENFTNKSNVIQKRFVCEAFFVPARQAAVAAEKQTYRYNVGGTAAQNPTKTVIVSSISTKEKNNEEVKIPTLVQRYELTNQTIYRVYLAGESCDAGNGAGEITDVNPALEDMFKTQESISGYAVGLSGRNTYYIELMPQGRDISEFYPDIDNAIRRCVDQAPALEEKTQMMMESGFTDPAIKAVLEQMPSVTETKGVVPKPKTMYRQRKGYNLSDLVSYMLLGKTVRLVGEKGSGKNTLVETACWLMSRPMCRIQGSSELDKLDLLGSRTLKDGSTGFELSNALETLENNGVVVVDEANTVRPDVLTLLHSLTDGARSIDVPGYGPVKMGDHACILYTMNEGYVGTGEMNAATVDRGPTIIVKQEDDLSALLQMACPDAAEDDISTCVKVSKAIQKAVRESGTLAPDAVTVRGFIDALMVSHMVPLKRALIQNVADKAQSESERTALVGIISGFLP